MSVLRRLRLSLIVSLLLGATNASFAEGFSLKSFFLRTEPEQVLAGGSNEAGWVRLNLNDGGEADVATTELAAGDAAPEVETCDHSATCDCEACQQKWGGQFEIGLNGAEGNSRNVNLVFGLDAKRKVGLDTWSIDLDYLFSRNETAVTKDRFYSLTRYEHEIPDSRWGWFAESWFEYDGMEAFRSRFAIHGGGSLKIIDKEDNLLKALAGMGASREIEGNDRDWKPEVFLGSLWERKLSERQNFSIRTVVYPDVSQSESYRVNMRAKWECKLSDERDIKLSLSAFDRYDSTPNAGQRKNNVDYWASLVWGF